MLGVASYAFECYKKRPPPHDTAREASRMLRYKLWVCFFLRILEPSVQLAFQCATIQQTPSALPVLSVSLHVILYAWYLKNDYEDASALVEMAAKYLCEVDGRFNGDQ